MGAAYRPEVSTDPPAEPSYSSSFIFKDQKCFEIMLAYSNDNPGSVPNDRVHFLQVTSYSPVHEEISHQPKINRVVVGSEIMIKHSNRAPTQYE